MWHSWTPVEHQRYFKFHTWMVKMFRKKYFAKAQISSKNFKPLWSLYWKKGTIINPSSKNKGLGDIGHSMSMIPDTRISIFGVNSGYNFIFDSLWHLITKHAEFFYKIQQKVVIKCVRFFIRKCHTLHKKCSYSELFWSLLCKSIDWFLYEGNTGI